MQGRVWTAGRKWMGNLIPLAFMLPLGVHGVVTVDPEQEVTPAAIGLCVRGLGGGLVAGDLLGFFRNGAPKAEIQKEGLAEAGRDASGGTFVGFARPSYSGLL